MVPYLKDKCVFSIVISIKQRSFKWVVAQWFGINPYRRTMVHHKENMEMIVNFIKKDLVFPYYTMDSIFSFYSKNSLLENHYL